MAPNGMISFISAGRGGWTSDKHIVNQSGFLDLLDTGDIILADRGFTINSELLMLKAKLHIPLPSSGVEQQKTTDVAKTRKIANARIHVERAIGRMKWFAILKKHCAYQPRANSWRHRARVCCTLQPTATPCAIVIICAYWYSSLCSVHLTLCVKVFSLTRQTVKG